MKFIKNKNNKKGFTLIEMITALAVLAILLGFISTIFVQMMGIETELTDVGQMEIIATESMSELLDDLRLAKEVDATDADYLRISTDSYTAIYSIDPTDGILMREYEGADDPGANPVLAEGFYMGNTIDLQWTYSGDAATSDYSVTVDMTMYDSKGEVVHTDEYLVRPSYMNAN